MMNLRPSLLWIVAIVAGVLTAVVRRFIFPDARWWNLMMAGLLLAWLAVYLWQEWRTKS